LSIRIKFGWGATFLWVTLWAILLYSDWNNAIKMGFNEWGDFFAGASAPLAFLWLVIGYFQQGEELNQNTKALEHQEKALQQQVDELKQSVEQQGNLALAQKKQTEISTLMAKLEALNHMLDSIERQIARTKKSAKTNIGSMVKQYEVKQVTFERKMEELMIEIDKLEGENDDG